eukprot:TRINITY_DN14543_c0_g1_i1.p2 TRINITY_DN14543_c0_g1~~TRINITY_DN14543_c0_g1_i1.p2  ORF type:complete len:109 (-),score=27.28 TRINITY_DN14543_c0_g1_i1:24-350(-)
MLKEASREQFKETQELSYEQWDQEQSNEVWSAPMAKVLLNAFVELACVDVKIFCLYNGELKECVFSPAQSRGAVTIAFGKTAGFMVLQNEKPEAQKQQRGPMLRSLNP